MVDNFALKAGSIDQPQIDQLQQQSKAETGTLEPDELDQACNAIKLEDQDIDVLMAPNNDYGQHEDQSGNMGKSLRSKTATSVHLKANYAWMFRNKDQQSQKQLVQ